MLTETLLGTEVGLVWARTWLRDESRHVTRFACDAARILRAARRAFHNRDGK